MPLSKRARIEVYLVVENSAQYRRLRNAVETEFVGIFGGCTIIRGAKGQYLSAESTIDTDDIDVVYVDLPFAADTDFASLSSYTDNLNAALLEATSEESVLIVVHKIFHSA